MPRKVTYTLNNKVVSGRKFALIGVPAAILSLGLFVTAILVYPVALWTNNTVLTVGALVFMLIMNVRNRLKGKKNPSTPYSVVNFLGFVVFSFAMWHHNPLFIVIGILMMIRFTFAAK